ncbi:uncharacterized protein LOC142317898 [Lycorma delicatula]|uniref:uncharacterized protein LOC142317898 n=1 Tax=Lycorma delicatula TaxID=130591 RepID=UPI003F50EDA0
MNNQHRSLTIEEFNLVKRENVKVEYEVESEISLNNDIPPRINLKINDVHTVKAEEEEEFYPGHESEILLNDDVSPQVNLNMKSNELRIKDFRTVKTKDGMVFYPCRVIIDKLTITASTKNCKRCVNNSVYDGIIKQKSSECNCANGDVRTESLVKDISSENELPQQKGKKLVCEYCNEGYRCKCFLKKDINFHAKEKENNYPSNLKQHLNIPTKEKNYICNFCQKSFNSKSYLKIHLNIHTEEKNYICNFCQKSFNRKESLKIHLNIHTKEKNYICNFCQKSFNRKSHLKIHLNIHTKEKNYICNFCQKSFNRKESLKIHLNIHTKEKNYICNFCQKSFYRKDSLKNHLDIHTKEKNICNFCQKSFNCKSSLKYHLNIHTKEKNYISLFLIIDYLSSQHHSWGSLACSPAGIIVDRLRQNLDLCLLNNRSGKFMSSSSGAFSCIDLSECPMALEAAEGLLSLGVSGAEVNGLILDANVAGMEWYVHAVDPSNQRGIDILAALLANFRNGKTNTCFLDS